MPTYQFKCSRNHVTEKFFPAPRIKIRCGSKRCRGAAYPMIGGGSAVLFKGSGFYATDHPKPAKVGQAKWDKTEEAHEKRMGRA